MSVIQTEVITPSLAMQFRQSASLVSAPPDWIDSASQNADYWYLLSGSRVFSLLEEPRSARTPTPDSKGNVASEIVYDFPLSEGKSWCPSDPPPSYNPDCTAMGRKRAIRVGSYVTPAGTFGDCYQITQEYNSGGVTEWFCNGVGVVARKYDHGGTPFGLQDALISFAPGSKSNIPDQTDWITFSGTGLGPGNRAILDGHPGIQAPVITLAYPPSWQRQDTDESLPPGANKTWLNFKFTKHESGVPPSTGEAPGPSDAFIDFALVLSDKKPSEYSDTQSLGYGATDQVVTYGNFNGHPAMFAVVGDGSSYLNRIILFQVSPRMLIEVQVEFFAEGSSAEYAAQTLQEIDGILKSIIVH